MGFSLNPKKLFGDLMDSISPGSDSNLAGQLKLDLTDEQAMLTQFQQYYQQQAEDAYMWQTDQYAHHKDRIDRMDEVYGSELRSQISHAQQLRQQYNDMYKGAEEKSFAAAMSYDTPYRRNSEAARATAETAKAFDQQKQQAIADLASYGIQPDDRQALDREVTIAKATEQVNQANSARRFVEERGQALVDQQVQLGMQKDAASSGLMQQAIGTGNAMLGQQAQLGLGASGQAASALGNTMGYENLRSAIPGQSANIKLSGEEMRMGFIKEDYDNKVRAKESRNATIMSGITSAGKMAMM